MGSSRTSREILKGKINGSQTVENPNGQIYKRLDQRCQNTARDGRMEKTGITPEYLGEQKLRRSGPEIWLS